jgi:hypothetical protein
MYWACGMNGKNKQVHNVIIGTEERKRKIKIRLRKL